MYWVYILFSDKLEKYYVGSTNNLTDRLKRHNSKQSTYTKKGVPWNLVASFECDLKSEAVRFEKKI
ncbi:MAG: GIY-YIG nuclease family protein [Cytophagales bacterium]|nr:GIY-YIG nuclease family protein [Cytophagales bacterium]